MASGSSKIPWSRLQEAQQEYILDEYLPAGGVILKQYHHYRNSTANALLQHWTTRQAAGLIPFRFTRAVTLSRRSEEPGTDITRNAQEQGASGDANLQESPDPGASNVNDAGVGDEPTEDLPQPAASSNSSREQRGKRRRKSQGIDDENALPQIRRSDRTSRPTESARAMQ